MDDASIIELFIARDERAIAEVGAKYGALCRGVAQSVLGDPGDAEEVFSDVLLTLWNNIPPEKPDSLKAYAMAITRRRALKALRDGSTKKRGGGIASEPLDELSEILPSRESVESSVEANELKTLINRWLGSLNKEDRALFLRRYWYEDTVSELAQKLGCTPQRTAKRLGTLRRKLRTYLEREGHVL